MRFWGKIMCRNKDYFIAEGMIDSSNRENFNETAEGCGQGCNKLTFWATNSVLDDWTELP